MVAVPARQGSIKLDVLLLVDPFSERVEVCFAGWEAAVGLRLLGARALGDGLALQDRGCVGDGEGVDALEGGTGDGFGVAAGAADGLHGVDGGGGGLGWCGGVGGEQVFAVGEGRWFGHCEGVEEIKGARGKM